MRHHRPAIDQGLEFCRRAQVVQQGTHFGDVTHRQQRLAQAGFGCIGGFFGIERSAFHWHSIGTGHAGLFK
jgi:hypothetical protein